MLSRSVVEFVDESVVKSVAKCAAESLVEKGITLVLRQAITSHKIMAMIVETIVKKEIKIREITV